MGPAVTAVAGAVAAGAVAVGAAVVAVLTGSDGIRAIKSMSSFLASACAVKNSGGAYAGSCSFTIASYVVLAATSLPSFACARAM